MSTSTRSRPKGLQSRPPDLGLSLTPSPPPLLVAISLHLLPRHRRLSRPCRHSHTISTSQSAARPSIACLAPSALSSCFRLPLQFNRLAPSPETNARPKQSQIFPTTPKYGYPRRSLCTSPMCSGWFLVRRRGRDRLREELPNGKAAPSSVSAKRISSVRVSTSNGQAHDRSGAQTST